MRKIHTEITILVDQHGPAAYEAASQEAVRVVKENFYDIMFLSYSGPQIIVNQVIIEGGNVAGIEITQPTKAYEIKLDITNPINKDPNTSEIDIEFAAARGVPLAISLLGKTPAEVSIPPPVSPPVSPSTDTATATPPTSPPSTTPAVVSSPATPTSTTVVPDQQSQQNSGSAAPNTVTTNNPPPSKEDAAKELQRQLDSVSLVFPLQTEVTLKISDWPNYISKLTTLFDFYKKQMALKNINIENYNLSSELGPLLAFIPQLSLIIAASNVMKPVVATNPNKLSVLDYEYLTLRIVDSPTNIPAFSPPTPGVLAPSPEQTSAQTTPPAQQTQTQTAAPTQQTQFEFEATRKVITFKVNSLDNSVLSQLESFIIQFAKDNYYDKIFRSFDGPIVVSSRPINNKQFPNSQQQVSLQQLTATGAGTAYEITLEARNAIRRDARPTESRAATAPFDILVDSGIDATHIAANPAPPRVSNQNQTSTPPPADNTTPPAVSTGPITAGLTPSVDMNFEKRKFSDGSERDVRIYNRIDYCYMTNSSTGESLLVSMPINAGISGLSPTTLALIFNMLQIIDKQMNSPVPTSLMLCKGNITELGKIQGALTSVSAGLNEITGQLAASKVLLQDFLAAYTHPWRQAGIIPLTKTPIKGCTDQLRMEALRLQASIRLYTLQKDIVYGSSLTAAIDPKEKKRHEEEKARLAEINKVCTNTLNVSVFDSLELLKKNLQNFDLGKLFSEFINKINLPCIIDEALKCVMPQMPCEDLLRDLSIDNLEDRLKMAFPHAGNLVHAITLNVQEYLETKDAERLARGEPPLDVAGRSKAVLEGINKFIDLEALCKIDLNAIIALIKAIFSFEFPSFNFFDWQFNFKVDFDLAILNAILQALLAIIQKLLDELVGCDALLNLIAWLVNDEVSAPTGLYGDLFGLFNGDMDFSNTTNALSSSYADFLNQTSDEFTKLIKFEMSASNPTIGSLVGSGTLGVDTLSGSGAVGNLGTKEDLFGGLIRTSTYTTGNVGSAGFKASETQFVGSFDTTKLTTNEGQKNFLKEIGTFQVTGDTSKGIGTVKRISDDSVVVLMDSMSKADITASAPSSLEQELSSADSVSVASLSTGKGISKKTHGTNDIFSSRGLRSKNRHILNALAIHNERTKTTSVVMNQKELSNQIKEFVRTTFSLLSPSEVIDLVSGKSTEEINLTLVGITQIRYPLINAVLQYPERHALLFATFGKITQLDTVGPRLQLLATNPKTKRKMVDPNSCAPFRTLSDFRKSLMENALPSDLANKLMDDLEEDDRKRANDLMDALSKGIAPTDILDNPNLLKANKTLDGKPIQEVDKIVNDTISNIFDKIKLKFDEELETFPDAVSTSRIETETIYEKMPRPAAGGIHGFVSREEGEETTNLKYSSIFNAYPSEQAAKDAVLKNDRGSYFLSKNNVKIPGGLYKKIFENYKAQVKNDSRNSFEVEVLNSVPQQSPNDNPISAIRLSANDKPQSPEWNFVYSEKPNRSNGENYQFAVRTRGLVENTYLPYVNFQENSKFSGSLVQSEAISQELSLLPTYNLEIEPQISDFQRMAYNRDNLKPDVVRLNSINGRLGAFVRIAMDGITNVYKNEDNEIDSTTIKSLRTGELKQIYSDLVAGVFQQIDLTQDPETDLLREVPASELGSKKTALLNLIDFSPLPTEEQKACGIDTHLLQTDAVTKRVKDEYDNSTPDNLINKNSRVNTRYTDQKPGHLSEKIMTGLAETFIRTSVIHNIFKGLFLLTKQRFNLTEFGMLEILYIFLESRVRMDVERQGLTEDFEKEYEKIFDIYKKQEKPLIPEDDNGSNKLRSIVRYHIDSVTEHLSKMLNIKEDTEIKQFSALLRRRSKDMFRIPPTAINKDPISKKRRDNFFKNIDKPGPYMNFWKKNPEVYDILIPTKHHDGSQKTTTLHGSYTIVAYTPDKLLKSNLWYDNVLSNMSLTYDINDPDINSWKRMPKLILEKYVRIQKSDYMTQKFVQLLSNNQDFNNLVHKYISRSDFDGVITLENYSILVADFNTAKAKSSTLSNVYLYKNESELQENEISFLAMPPKFGMRLSLLKEEKSFRLYDPNQEENILNENGGFIYNYSFMGGTLQDSTKITNNKAFISFKEKFTNNIDPQYLFNKKEKIGYIQPYYDSGWQQRYQRESIYELYRNGAKEDRPRFEGQSRDLTEREDNAAVEAQNQYLKDHPNSSWLDRSASVINIIPLIQYEEETPEELFRPPASVADFEREKGIFKLAVEEMYEDTSLEDKIKNDYKFDLLVNYCLPYGMQNTFALLNCMVGMVDEKIMKLLDGTKTIIKDSYKNQKSAGRFRSNPKSGKYEKSKKAEQDGPFPAAFAKAALTIPISTLKGMATSVDPNIFYADKIVLAGKMGFVQPKYRRLSVGEKYRIEGTNQFLEISEEGIASKSDFKYDDGELVVRNPATQDTGYEIEYTYVAKVENKKIVKRRDSEGKMVYVVKQGLGYSGVPVKREGNEFTLVNSQVDEKEVETFDMQPSVPIFPGEKIDIPYAIASLLLAPLPIFPPGASLTAYNLAMPFGPIFLALEPLLFETQQFKTAKTKKKNTPEDTSGNLSCKTPEQLSQTGSAGDANSKPPLNLMELLTRSNDEALDSVFNTITTQIIPHINITFSVASKTDFIKNKLFKSLKENGIEFTEQILSQITEFIKTNHSITKERLRKFLNK